MYGLPAVNRIYFAGRETVNGISSQIFEFLSIGGRDIGDKPMKIEDL
jgi:hypothetical protein